MFYHAQYKAVIHIFLLYPGLKTENYYLEPNFYAGTELPTYKEHFQKNDIQLYPFEILSFHSDEECSHSLLDSDPDDGSSKVL
jgi:hypothetical protein